MKIFSRTVAFAGAFAVLTTAVFAQSVVGAWKGKVSMDLSKFPKAQNPQQQQMIDQMVEQMKKMQISLSLAANKTYTATASGLPGQQGAQKAEGKWTLAGRTLTLTTTKENGKAPKNNKPQKFTLSPDGKKLTMVMEQGGPPGMSLVFTKS
jgi:hypothetical protein